MRLTWIDIAKGICIYFVVLSHTTGVPLFYRSIFEPFFLTAFFFLSGVVFKTDCIQKTLWGSLTKVLWPYFINAVVIMFGKMQWINMLLSNDISGTIDYFQKWGIKILEGKAFWFLACLFITQIAAMLITYLLRNNKVAITTVAIFCFASIYLISGQEITLWSSNTAILALGYFLIGIVCREKILSYKIPDKNRYIGYLAVILYISIITIIFKTTSTPYAFDIHTHKLSPEILYLALSFIGIIALCLFAMSIKHSNILQMFGLNSLTIYMYHSYGNLFINTLFAVTGINALATSPYIYTILVSSSAIAITLVIALIINKYCPILIGRGHFFNQLSNKILH